MGLCGLTLVQILRFVMFNGQILYIGHNPSEDIVREAVRLAEGLRAQKEALGATSMIKGYDLPDGTIVGIADLSDTWTVQIEPPVVPADWPVHISDWVELPISEPLPIISFVSGAVTTGTGQTFQVEIPVEGQREPRIVSVFAVVNPDSTVKRVMGGFPRKTADLFTAAEAGVKVGVPQHAAFLTLGDDTPRTHFQSHDPGLFTGAMAPLVQLLLGVGRLLEYDYEQRLIKDQPERTQPLIRETLMLGQVETDIWEVKSLVRTTPEHELYKTQIQLMYDYRWFRTHGITWGSRTPLEYAPDLYLMADPHRTQEPFLVELSNQGVAVTPLPRDIASFYPEVRDQYLRVYPELNQYRPFNGNSLFDGLGGFPTGASIPANQETRQRWIRAGYLVVLPNALSSFYAGDALYSGHGWAFSSNGRKAVNICRKWRNGHQFSECHELSLEISQRSNIEFQIQADMVIEKLNLTDPVEIHKAHRLTNDQVQYIFSPLLRGNHKSEYEAFDELEVQADWLVIANLTMIRSGSISVRGFICSSGYAGYGGAAYVPGFGFSVHIPGVVIDPCKSNGLRFKVFESLLGGVIDVDFSVHPLVRHNAPAADGPIFVTYVRDSLEILNLYVETEAGGWVKKWWNDRQPCQFVGSWSSGETKIYARPNGNFYTSSKDFRIVNMSRSTKERITSARILGYEDMAENCQFFGMHIWLSRTYFYTTSFVEDTDADLRSRNVAVMCAANNRSVFFVCEQVLSKGGSSGKGTGGKLTVGKTGRSIVGVIRHFVWHWVSCASCARKVIPTNTYQECGEMRNTGCGAMFWPTERPAYLNYSVGEDGMHYGDWNSRVTGDVSGILGSALYSPKINVPAAWSEFKGKKDRIEYEIYGFGLPEMNGRLIHEEKYTQMEGEEPLEFLYSGAPSEWWRCAMPECSVAPWYVMRNHYGKPFVITNSNIEWGDTVEYGVRPNLAGGLGRHLFGIVE